MKTIIVKFEFPDESLEGYEDCIDELIIEDHLIGCNFDNVGFEVVSLEDFQWDYEKDGPCPICGQGPKGVQVFHR